MAGLAVNEHPPPEGLKALPISATVMAGASKIEVAARRSE